MQHGAARAQKLAAPCARANHLWHSTRSRIGSLLPTSPPAATSAAVLLWRVPAAAQPPPRPPRGLLLPLPPPVLPVSNTHTALAPVSCGVKLPPEPDMPASGSDAAGLSRAASGPSLLLPGCWCCAPRRGLPPVAAGLLASRPAALEQVSNAARRAALCASSSGPVGWLMSCSSAATPTNAVLTSCMQREARQPGKRTPHARMYAPACALCYSGMLRPVSRHSEAVARTCTARPSPSAKKRRRRPSTSSLRCAASAGMNLAAACTAACMQPRACQQQASRMSEEPTSIPPGQALAGGITAEQRQRCCMHRPAAGSPAAGPSVQQDPLQRSSHLAQHCSSNVQARALQAAWQVRRHAPQSAAGVGVLAGCSCRQSVVPTAAADARLQRCTGPHLRQQ